MRMLYIKRLLLVELAVCIVLHGGIGPNDDPMSYIFEGTKIKLNIQPIKLNVWSRTNQMNLCYLQEKCWIHGQWTKTQHNVFIYQLLLSIYVMSFSIVAIFTQARIILERHLVIADKAFTMAELRSMGNESIVLPTMRDALTIRVREENKRKWML